MRWDLIFLLVISINQCAFGQSDTNATAIPDVVVMGQFEKYSGPRYIEMVTIYNKSGVTIDSLFVGCDFLGSISANDSISVLYAAFKNIVAQYGAPIGPVKTRKGSCADRDIVSFCVGGIIFRRYRYEKKYTCLELDIVTSVSESGEQGLIWQRHR